MADRAARRLAVTPMAQVQDCAVAEAGASDDALKHQPG